MTKHRTSGNSATRRTILGGALTLAVGTLGGFAPAQADDLKGTVTLMAYSGLFQDKYTEAVVKPFEKAHPGVTVKYYTTGNSAQMLGTLRAQKGSPQVDVVIFDASTSLIGDKEGLLAKLPVSENPVIGELSKQAIIKKGYGPAVTFDNLVFVYSKKAFPTPPTSIDALWDKKLKGRLGISSMPNIQGAALLAIVAKSLGEDYTKSVSKAVDKLATLSPSVQTFDPKPDGYTMVLNGDLDMATGWNARAQFYAQKNPDKLGVMLPKEGSVLQINTINLVKGAPNTPAAKAFIDYALSAKAQKAFTEAMYYAPVNPKAKISAEAGAKTAASKLDQMLPFDWAWEATVAGKWTKDWQRKIVPGR
ncbi:ABC transporter substrate-binding protein [Acidimangrovimonas sediminis]|uniref:ABC transporter substrate-binding protein n=1 Tax=Acidimangrovimonas sediminis TaxID=2056283 RepID=UPI000C807F28|nr:ABC transporter substrate-binding protein [Acidimangrovimonas sediminis]